LTALTVIPEVSTFLGGQTLSSFERMSASGPKQTLYFHLPSAAEWQLIVVFLP
jgi:hypothetical protein